MKPAMRTISAVAVIGLFVLPQAIWCQSTTLKRCRGEGLYACASASTIGAGNVWTSLQAVGFIWDNSDTSGGSSKSNVRAFPEASIEAGILDYLSLYGESRILSYGYKPGYITAGIKATLPNTRKLRLNCAGVTAGYRYSLLDQFPSLGGYRLGGTGFSPEGFMVKGGSLEFKALYELDLIAWLSWLPLKFMADFGTRLPLDTFRDYKQYLFSSGVEYAGLGVDFFLEYSIEGLINNSQQPKKFAFDVNGDGTMDVWEVAFMENPMFLTPGGRIRYENGVTLFCCVPLLLSHNVGSDMTMKSKNALWAQFPDEAARGITMGFDPWYTKWKIIAGISFPIRFRQTSAEMIRNFTLLKNQKSALRIDIDERINALNSGAPGDTAAQEQQDTKRRLDEIKKQREQIDKESK